MFWIVFVCAYALFNLFFCFDMFYVILSAQKVLVLYLVREVNILEMILIWQKNIYFYIRKDFNLLKEYIFLILFYTRRDGTVLGGLWC